MQHLGCAVPFRSSSVVAAIRMRVTILWKLKCTECKFTTVVTAGNAGRIVGVYCSPQGRDAREKPVSKSKGLTIHVEILDPRIAWKSFQGFYQNDTPALPLQNLSVW